MVGFSGSAALCLWRPSFLVGFTAAAAPLPFAVWFFAPEFALHVSATETTVVTFHVKKSAFAVDGKLMLMGNA